jgi:FtsP/CotA-like multicopper oxidase with cupredoxin domain
MLDQYEVRRVIDLTGDTHPIHLHLDPFQILARHSDQLRDPVGASRTAT